MDALQKKVFITVKRVGFGGISLREPRNKSGNHHNDAKLTLQFWDISNNTTR